MKMKVDYFNNKYLTYVNTSMRKLNRHSPYYITFEAETLDVFGNNLTVREKNAYVNFKYRFFI